MDQAYVDSITKVFNKQLAGSAGGKLESIEETSRDLVLTVVHPLPGLYDMVLLDFAIVCDLGENWSFMLSQIDRVVLAIHTDGAPWKEFFALPLQAIIAYHTNTVKDDDLIAQITPLPPHREYRASR